MIFVDSNIPMYLIGAPHPHKDRAKQVLEELLLRDTPMITSAEVMQEILHRYVAIRRPEAIEPALACLQGLVQQIATIEPDDVFAARDIVLRHAGLSARDALHVAVMRRLKVTQILSFDAGFDQVRGVKRLR